MLVVWENNVQKLIICTFSPLAPSSESTLMGPRMAMISLRLSQSTLSSGETLCRDNQRLIDTQLILITQHSQKIAINQS